MFMTFLISKHVRFGAKTATDARAPSADILLRRFPLFRYPLQGDRWYKGALPPLFLRQIRIVLNRYHIEDSRTD